MLSNHTTIKRAVASLDPLFALYPPKEILIVGNKSTQWLKHALSFPVDAIHYIDPESRSLSHVKQLYNDTKLQYYRALIAGIDGKISYYRYSYPALNGILPSAILKSYWKNIDLLRTKQKQATALSTFFQAHDLKPNYLILDTLSGEEILSNCNMQTLDMFDVIVLTTLSTPAESSILSDDLFVPLQSIPHAHPHVHTVIYVKDYKKQLYREEGRGMEYIKLQDELIEKDQILEQFKEQKGNVKQHLQKQIKLLHTKIEETQEQLYQQKNIYEQKVAETKQLLKEKEEALQEEGKKKQALKAQLKKQIGESQNQIKSLQTQLQEMQVRTQESKEAYETKIANLDNEIQQLMEHKSKNQAELNQKLKELEYYKSLILLDTNSFSETEYVINQSQPNIGYEALKYIALAENAFKHQEYQKAIFYWQHVAAQLEDQMPQLYYRRLQQAYKHIGGYPLASEEEEVLYGTYDKHEALKGLHTILQPKLYLEIGVQTGKSLQLAECKAIGIDPMPMLKDSLKINMELYECTSDVFFTTYAKETLKKSPDLVFIDGMHLFEYALRDFMNVELYASQNTIVVIDDIYPGHPAQAERDRKTRAWTGDVWKLLAILREYRPDLKITTLDIHPTGLMIIQNIDPKNTILHDHYDEIVEKYMHQGIDEKLYIKRDGAVDPKEFLETLKKEDR